jgi:hydrogenase/urease accessory protein HupE
LQTSNTLLSNRGVVIHKLGYLREYLPQVEVIIILVFLLSAPVIAIATAKQGLFGNVLFGYFAFYHGGVHILVMPSLASVTGYAAGLLFLTGLLLVPGVTLRQVINAHKYHGTSPGQLLFRGQ